MNGPTHHSRSTRRGVGYVEFLIAVLLVGLVASVAIPQFLDLRRKAMRAEPIPNLRSIGVAQQAYYAAESDWIAAAPNPVPPVSQVLRAFDRARPDWQPLGWYPEGEVRCTYWTTLLDRTTHVRADALCDLDGDDQVMIIRYDVPANRVQGEFTDLYPERY